MTQNDPALPSSAQAREQLAAARELAAVTSRRGAAVGSVTTAGVGVLVAGALSAAYAFTPEHRVAFELSLVAYWGALMLLMLWQRRTQVVAQYGYGRAYRASLVVTIALYGIGVAVLPEHLSWLAVAAYCVLVALPMIITGVRMAVGVRR